MHRKEFAETEAQLALSTSQLEASRMEVKALSDELVDLKQLFKTTQTTFEEKLAEAEKAIRESADNLESKQK